ncbi:MAG: bifunctional riboflavin kinase/FAD synthetase [Candidatus Delongbacteria bacterium]
MNVIEYLESIKNEAVSLTLGSYDGLHSGHVLLLNELKKISAQSGTASLVISFYPHPRKVIDRDYDMHLLNTREEKITIINSLGIDHIHFINFTKDFASTGYSEFYRDYIFSVLKVKNIIAGTNHHFGRNRKGDSSLLSDLCSEYSVNLISVPPVSYENETVSSTRIRRSLAEGNVEDASKMLGYDYFVSGKIIRGRGIGSKIGFPTANLDTFDLEKVIPGKGVYFTSLTIKDQDHYAVTNIGQNPTVGGSGINIESHIIDGGADLYGETVKISFLKRMRDEVKFPSENELAKALRNDVVRAREMINAAESKR